MRICVLRIFFRYNVHQSHRLLRAVQLMWHCGVRLSVSMIALLFVATNNFFPISKFSSDFKNSKNKTCFRTFWGTLVFGPNNFFVQKSFFSSDFKNSKTKMCFRTFWGTLVFGRNNFLFKKVFFHHISKIFKPKCVSTNSEAKDFFVQIFFLQNQIFKFQNLSDLCNTFDYDIL